MCSPHKDFATETIDTKILVAKQTKEIARLKKKNLFNAATFPYVFKPVKAVEMFNEDETRETYILCEWPGYPKEPKQ